ncbi:MAG: Hsp20/alpha crystallin family protein [Burkholderiaceae bacterium]|nr:Hsp20/alpha crystallin family protein [Burkholderiales bacterium]TAL65112.1 MAG: Hsp20/alpha crystallin family protein [Burkholderiaceae bacterium]TBR77287.1 MAG: Hsp20/alpha crystallin family protein [Burkholderiaceae bacterium]
MYGSLFSRNVFAELDRLQRDMQSAFELSPSIRGYGHSGFPALNVGTTPQSVELFAFAPGIDPASIDVNLERGLLTVAGRRETGLPQDGGEQKAGDGATVYINERFAGSFSRAISLPDDVDADAVSADYKNGVLHVSVKRKESARPRRISVNA